MSFTIFQNEKTLFQAIKTRSSKSRKIDIFPKGLTHGFAPKMAIFPIFFFQAIQARNMSFTIFQKEKTPFQAIKTKSLNSRKIDIFSKGLPMVLVQKWQFFQLFFFQAIQPREMSFTIFQKEKTPFQPTKTRSSKRRKIDIFPKALPILLVQKLHFFELFFQAIQATNMSFMIFQKEKMPFQAIKTKR